MNRKEFVLGASAGGLLLTQKSGMTTAAGERFSKPPVPRRAVIPAALTAIDKDGRLDIAEFRRHIITLANVKGVSAIMVNGAAGHASTLTRDERRKLLGVALEVVGDRVPILAALSETQDHPTLAPFAKDAQAEGAKAMTIMPPAKVADYVWDSARARFDDACFASTLPIVIYQIHYDTETLTRLASLAPVFAIKEGNGSPAIFERNLRALRALHKNVAVWSTHSSWLLADLATED